MSDVDCGPYKYNPVLRYLCTIRNKVESYNFGLKLKIFRVGVNLRTNKAIEDFLFYSDKDSEKSNGK